MCTQNKANPLLAQIGHRNFAKLIEAVSINKLKQLLR